MYSCSDLEGQGQTVSDRHMHYSLAYCCKLFISNTYESNINSNFYALHERFLRKNNVRIVGLQSAANEHCRQIASDVFKNILKRGVKIERAHRDGRTYHNISSRSQH